MSKFLDWFNKDKKSPENDQKAISETEQALDQKACSASEQTVDNHKQPNTQEASQTKTDASPVETIVESVPKAIEKASEVRNVTPSKVHTGKVTSPNSIKSESIISESVEGESVDEESDSVKENFLTRLKKGLAKTGDSIGAGMANLFLGKQIDDELFEDLETQLLMADIGIDTTSKIIDELTDLASRSQLKKADDLYPVLKQHLANLLEPISTDFDIDSSKKPFVILMVGVNGVGKTTTIGKMAKQLQHQGKSVMLAAGDTFRAAAVEQLQVWGERNDVPVIAQHTGADSASVLFDALQSAKAKNADVLIADTAGRLQNKDHLMEELKKVVRVMKKLDPQAPHEIMLTLDAGTGQNALSQMHLFSEAVGVTGITLSKLDGTAKGGVIFALADKYKVPVRYIGVGESINDLQPFDGKTFVDALFEQEK